MKTLTIIGSSGFLGRSIIDYAFLKSLSKWKINKIVSISRKKIKLPKKGKVKIKHYARDISKFKKLPRTDYIIYAINTNNSFSDLKSIKKFVELIKNMPPNEFLGDMLLLIVGGNDTTRNSISGGLVALNE